MGGDSVNHIAALNDLSSAGLPPKKKAPAGHQSGHVKSNRQLMLRIQVYPYLLPHRHRASPEP